MLTKKTDNSHKTSLKFPSKILKVLVRKVLIARSENLLFISVLIFYSALWIINPANKVIAASFSVLIVIFYLILKNFRFSMLLGFIASLIIPAGKKYLFELVPPGVFSKDIFPQGLVLSYTITPGLILSVIMGLILVRDFVARRDFKLRIGKIDFFLIFYVFWSVLTDVFGSARPNISIIFSITKITALILYFYIKTYALQFKNFLNNFSYLICCQVVFESLISVQQFLNGAPIYKSIENHTNIEYFGHAADELALSFRPIGTFSHANVLGLWLSVYLLTLFAYIFKKPGYIFYSTFLVGFVSLIITLSRSAWLGFGVGIMFVLFVFEKIKKIKVPDIFFRHIYSILSIGLVLLVFFVLPRVDRSLYTFVEGEGGGSFRISQIQDTLKMIFINPVLGVGSGMSVIATMQFDPTGVFSKSALSVHNWYLLLTVEHGIPATLSFLLFVFLFIKRYINETFKYRISKLIDYLRVGFLGGLFATIVIGFFQPFWGDAQVITFFAILSVIKKKDE